MYCQKCRSPLTLHKSLQDLSPAGLKLLTGSPSKSAQESIARPQSHTSAHPSTSNHPNERRDLYDRTSQNVSSPIVKRTVPSAVPRYLSPLTGGGGGGGGGSGGVQDSFVVLSDSVIMHAPDTAQRDSSPNRRNSAMMHNIDGAADDDSMLSHKMHTSQKLWEVLSARSDVDYPICADCTEVLVEGMTKKLQNNTIERDAFQEFVKKVQLEVPTDEEVKQAKQELKKAKEEEAAAMEELEKLEKMKEDMEKEIEDLERESKELEEQEEEFWRDRNDFAAELRDFQNERDSTNTQFDFDTKQLERLQRTNVYNDTFCIGHDGHFGTINGLRLGKLPQQPVEWSEINAAWGQVLLLLHTVADKLGFQFEGYRLKPMGSTSKIEKIELRAPSSSSLNGSTSSHAPEPKVQTLELFSSGTLPMGHLFAHRKFDGAMVAFLDCVKQLGDWVEKKDPNLTLPYKIVKDKIGEVSIRLTFNQDDPWTRACKYTLTCVKFLLAHTSNQGYAKRNQQQQQLREREQSQRTASPAAAAADT